MRHPMDFWKAMLLAQSFITGVYVFFGCFVSDFSISHDDLTELTRFFSF